MSKGATTTMIIPNDLPDQFHRVDLADIIDEIREQFDDDVQRTLLRDEQLVYLACALAEDVDFEPDFYPDAVGNLLGAITPEDMSYIAGNSDTMPTSPSAYLLQTYLENT